MKKVVCAVVAVLIMCGACLAKEPVHAGALTWLGTTEEAFQEGLDDLRKALAPLISENSDWMEEDGLHDYLVELVKTRRAIHFYDSLMSMQMALISEQLDEIVLPEAVAVYLLANNSKFDVDFSLNMMPSTISFGFKEGNDSLCKEFNEAIAAMKKDGTLARLERDYIKDAGAEEPEPVEFQEFEGAETIKAAVTGDMPPIDFIGAAGMPAGYNTAILAEIGRRLKKNVQLISVEAGGRTAALASDRADVVFWYRNTEGVKPPKDAAVKGFMKDSVTGVIMSAPYYEWDTDIVIGRAE